MSISSHPFGGGIVILIVAKKLKINMLDEVKGKYSKVRVSGLWMNLFLNLSILTRLSLKKLLLVLELMSIF